MKVSKIVESKARKFADKFMATPENRAAVFEWIYTHCQNQKAEGFHAGPAAAFGPHVWLIMLGKVSTTAPGVEIASSGNTITLNDSAKRNLYLQVPELAARGNGDVMFKLAFYQLRKPTDADRKRLPVRVAKPKGDGSGTPPVDSGPSSM